MRPGGGSAIAILRKNLPQLWSERVERTHAELTGFSAKATVDPEGVKTVLALRGHDGQA